MVSEAEFIVKFIAKSAGNGEDPANAAKEEIKEIDETLGKAEKLKVRRMKLLSVLDYLGDDTYKRRRSISTQSTDDVDSSSVDFTEIVEKIKLAIYNKGPLEVRDLTLEVGGYDQDILIMRAVKWLGDQEIVSRDESGRVQPGKNWKKEI
jgi:hypothetical protein